jgi:hypothetical protein
MSSPPNIKISPGMPSGPTNFLFLIADNSFRIMLMLIFKGLTDSVD